MRDLLPSPFGGSACVCLYVGGACICAHDSACLSGSSKALSGALCGPCSLPFQPLSFCLSVSYLIELAQKQSECRYLRLRTKPYWCLVEVSPLSVRITARILSRVSMSCTSKDIIHNDVPLFSLDCMVIEIPLPLHEHTLAHFQTGVLTDKWYTYGVAQRNKFECRPSLLISPFIAQYGIYLTLFSPFNKWFLSTSVYFIVEVNSLLVKSLWASGLLCILKLHHI